MTGYQLLLNAGERVVPAGTASLLATTAPAVFLGLAPSALGFVLWADAVARMDVGRVTTSLHLVPAAAIVIALVWPGQTPGPAELAGGAIALAGVILPGSSGRRPRPRPPREAAAGRGRGTSVRSVQIDIILPNGPWYVGP
jgi:drug/metabolite transporter (DMT)-like permease